MISLVLLIGVGFLLASIYFHAIAQANVIKKIDKAWYDRLFSGNRASVDNLNAEGVRNRKRSNVCIVAGFLMIGVYLLFNF